MGRPKSPSTDNLIRITVWIDRDLYLAFQQMHPQQGATTSFVRKWFEQYIKRIDKGVDQLMGEKTS